MDVTLNAIPYGMRTADQNALYAIAICNNTRTYSQSS